MIIKRQIGMVVAVMFAVTAISFAQSYSLVPSDTINITGMMEDLETMTIQQQNISTDTILLKWKKVSSNMPASWEASVCDNTICYTVLQDSGTMSPVYPADYGFVLLHITSHVNIGTAVIRYEVWDINYPLARDTLTFILTVNATSGIAEDIEKHAFCVFPNPANESFSISTDLQEGFQYSISDAAGKEVERGISEYSSRTITTAAWRKGLYSVSIISEGNIFCFKRIIVYK